MDGVLDDMGHVLVDQGVHRFSPLALNADETRPRKTRRCWETRGWLMSSRSTSS